MPAVNEPLGDAKDYQQVLRVGLVVRGETPGTPISCSKKERAFLR